MKDKNLRKSFRKLCEHLNVKYDDFHDEFRHEGYVDTVLPHDVPCKLARIGDLGGARDVINSMKEDIEALQESVAELRKPKRKSGKSRNR